MSVLAAGVYESGILADPRPGAHFRYEEAAPELVARVGQIAAVCAGYGVSLPAAALHYVLAHPDVTAVVVGARSDQRVRENGEFLRQQVPHELFDELAALGLAAPLA